MLAGAGFGDDPRLAHLLGQQALAQGVINLVGTRMVQVFALQVNLGAAQIFGHPFGIVEQGRTVGIIVEQVFQFSLEIRIILIMAVRFFQALDFIHQCFRYVLTAEGAKSSCTHVVTSCKHVLVP